MNKKFSEPTLCNPYLVSEEANALLAKLKQDGYSDMDILFLGIELAKRVSDGVAASYARAQDTEPEQGSFEAIKEACVELIETTITYMTVIVPEAEEAAVD